MAAQKSKVTGPQNTINLLATPHFPISLANFCIICTSLKHWFAPPSRAASCFSHPLGPARVISGCKLGNSFSVEDSDGICLQARLAGLTNQNNLFKIRWK